ncbi:DUF222 domain-containing protein [Tersicoccus sp. MR15.9]|uniref:HNH endonuclease signature motif containing protein n=1 Tax=Tersicoccus mangrovi TaxID=3121635 RepID=UPI002FE68D79
MEELFTLEDVGGCDHADGTGASPAVTGATHPPMDAAAMLRRIRGASSADDADATDTLVEALEDVRRLESWLAARKYALARDAFRSAVDDHAAWMAADPTWDDAQPGLRHTDATGVGLGRAERAAVAERSAIAEIACALRIGESAAQTLVSNGELLGASLPDTAAALAAGAITGAAARVIVDLAREYTTVPIPDAETDARVRTAVEQTERFLLDVARAGAATGEVGARARRLRERFHPVSRQQRHDVARSDRCVRVGPGQDGMARLSAWLPATDAHAIDHHLTTLARAALGPQLAAGSDPSPGLGSGHDAEERTVGQARADVLTDLVMHAPVRPAGADAVENATPHAPEDAGEPVGPIGPRPSLVLTMPASVLIGGDGPAVFGPFGVIAVEDARQLAATAASFTLGVTVDDDASPTGTRLVSAGRQYRIPAELRRRLQVRDGTCRFPGCRRDVLRCDLDHRVAWADGGDTDENNLEHLCRRHHVLKHHSGWQVTGPPEATNAGSGSVPTHPASPPVFWVSPTGRRYRSDPDDPPF